MLIENTTDENIYIFAGIFVPGKGALSVALESIAQVEASPLIASYIEAGELVLVKGEAPAAEPAKDISVKAAETKVSSTK